MNKIKRSYVLTKETVKLIEVIAENNHWDKSVVIDLAIQSFAKNHPDRIKPVDEWLRPSVETPCLEEKATV